jgi:hypothetical protein
MKCWRPCQLTQCSRYPIHTNCRIGESFFAGLRLKSRKNASAESHISLGSRKEILQHNVCWPPKPEHSSLTVDEFQFVQTS